MDFAYKQLLAIVILIVQSPKRRRKNGINGKVFRFKICKLDSTNILSFRNEHRGMSKEDAKIRFIRLVNDCWKLYYD